MSGVDIHTWIANSSMDDDDEHDERSNELNWDGDARNWPRVVDRAHHAVLQSSTKARTEFLEGQLLPIVTKGLDAGKQLDIFRVLTLTYQRYIDYPSRNAVERVVKALYDSQTEASPRIAQWILKEAERIVAAAGSTAASNQYALLGWACTIFSENVVHVAALAILLDALLDESREAKANIRRSAVVRARRVVRNSHQNIPAILSAILDRAKTSSSPTSLVPFLGLVVDVVLHLKQPPANVDELLGPSRAGIVALYTTNVLMSRTPVPSHVSAAFSGFIRSQVDQQTLTSDVLPVMEKAMLRSPEVALALVADFFVAYPGALDPPVHARLFTPVMNCAKSANAQVRSDAVRLFSVLPPSESAREEIVAVLKSGKTGGAEHRAALYAMLASTPAPIPDVMPLVLKETSDANLPLLASLLPRALLSGTAVDTATWAKELGSSSRIALRKALVEAAGEVFWADESQATSAVTKFAEQVVAPLSAVVKATSTTTLPSPLEAYVALAVLLGGKPREPFAKSAPSLAAVLGTAQKPGFLVLDKVYTKLNTAEEERWLLRAAQAATTAFSTELTSAKATEHRHHLGAVFIHLVLSSPRLETRRVAVDALKAVVKAAPNVGSVMLREALSRRDTSDGKRYQIVLGAAAPDPATDETLKEDLVVELIVLAHAPGICGVSQMWTDIVLRAGLDPRALAEKHVERLLALVLDSNQSEEARMSAVTTLTGIQPTLFLPRFIARIREALDPSKLRTLSEEDLEIWRTPEGVLCIDVLAAAKKGNAASKAPGKGKDADIQKWEAELRESLAAKKKTSVASLSKADQAIVNAQLAKESDVRRRVDGVRKELEAGLELVRRVVRARESEFLPYLGTLSALLLEKDGVVAVGSVLVGRKGIDAFLDLADCCTDRLGVFKHSLGVATLRALKIDGLPEEMTVEPLDGLLLRVLYRLRSLGEREPLDPASLTVASLMLSAVISAGGMGAADAEEALEQLALVVDILSFHCPSFAEPTYPRLETLRNLVRVIKHHPQLAKNAVSALLAAGEATARSTDAHSPETRFLLSCLLEQSTSVRHACLQTLQPFDLTELDWSTEVWIACQDTDEEVARLAENLWDENGLDVAETFAVDLLPLLEHDNVFVRTAAAAGIARGAQSWPAGVEQLLDALKAFFRDKAQLLEPQFDKYGLLIEESLNRQDQWPARLATAAAFEGLAPSMTEKDVVPFFAFLVNEEMLGDRHPDVRRGLLRAGTAVIDLYGKPCLPPLMMLFEDRLAAKTQTEAGDQVHEAVVVLLGRLARHLDPSDPRIPAVVKRLVDTLKTPVEQVQIAVSDCMAPLMKFVKPTVGTLIEDLLKQLFSAPKYAERRGAAYGLAGVVRGLGISSIPAYHILSRLQASLEDKKNPDARQGAMFAFETLPSTLGRVFEPYIVGLIPSLLASFGDAQADVREATQEAAKVIMSGLSGYGVKLILPSLLEALDEKQWRTKKAAIELLGSMAYLAPSQLSISLPTIIPRLTGVLTDSHAQVRAAANKSLKQFGEVISNPEIQHLVPVLLKAFVDPDKAPPALSALLKTTFAHYIDASSLALVIPIVERGMKERGAETKKKAAQIVGNMASLTDAKDFVPYLPRLMPLVHAVLSDPVPEARATAAKALGSLVERLGEDRFPDLIQNLLSTLKRDIPGIDRQGAAQGLSEVLSGLGIERMEGLLPDIIDNATSVRAYVREGFMSLLVFLPATFGARFHPHLPKIIPPILSGLADAEEYVREASMKAGRMIINNYSVRAVDLLLPELERSMFDERWRIRHSSVTLIGELLFKISGISGKAEIEEDDEEGGGAAAETSRTALLEVLGKERRDRVLASLYLVRQDGVNTVRQSAIHIWKALVHNTPRTVRDILPSMMIQIVDLLASDGTDQRETAARTVGELCKKFGERILRDIMPILNSSAQSPDSHVREGVCLALSEVMLAASETQKDDHENDIISIVRQSLVDESASVRTAAAQAFDVLQETIGAKAIDMTIPTLLEALRQPGESSGTALQALREVMAVRASTVFPVLIPTLIAPPITAFNARALASLVTVAGSALSKRLTVLLGALVKAREGEKDEEVLEELHETLSALLGAIEDVEGLNTLMLLLMEWVKHDNPTRRASAFWLFGTFCAVTELDFSLYRIDWIRLLISSLDDPNAPVVSAAWGALDGFVKAVPKDEYEGMVPTLRRAIEGTGAPGRTVPGFSVNKGVGPLVPVIIAGLTTGSSDQREAAATAIGDLVERTDETALKPFVVPFTGPLIRVATQAGAFPPGVKGAILGALAIMLERIPQLVKSFFPQLQRTFVKAASDPSSLVVRSKAAHALGVLMKSQTRVDPVVTELIGSVRVSREAGDEAVAASLVTALAAVAKNCGDNLGQASKDACLELLKEGFRDGGDEYYTQGIASLFSSLARFPNLLQSLVESHVLSGSTSVAVSQTILTSLHDTTASELLYEHSPELVARRVMACVGDERPGVSRPAREAREMMRAEDPWSGDDTVRAIVG
ncbi:ARM repeat-containing protein [Exidia glandulosa HHB12029]|uniref:ARM repeat-containing protein n=1 Tax=Exidia glandulosa HHB12029 TaxID=1314781 RepID=A0A165L8B5_EXIGL|nr:ARM repeat-containing protein [Exidia glandulosa HHB12029]